VPGCIKGAIASKIKHAIKQNKSCKTCTTVAQLLQPSLAANDGVSSKTGRYAVIGCKLKQNANEGCKNAGEDAF